MKATVPRPDHPDPDELRRRAERALRVSPAELTGMSEQDAQALLHELQVHQVELEIQNEELRKAQVELAEARDRYVELYEQAPAGYLTLDAHQAIREANLAAAAMLGVGRGELVGRALAKFAAPDDRDACYLHLRAVRDSGKGAGCELAFARPDGSVLHARLQTVPGSPQDDQAALRVTLSDITELWQTKQAIETLNEGLEIQVEDRTAELLETIGRLEDEIVRRRLVEHSLQERSQRPTDLNTQLQQRAAQLQSLAFQLSEAEERERRRLAEILHDDLQQLLSAAAMHLSAAGKGIQADPAAQSSLRTVAGLLTDSVRKARELSHELRPAVLEHGSILAVFQWLKQDMADKYRFDVQLDLAEDFRPQEPIKAFLYRSVRELLFNVVKHSGVRSAGVAIRRAEGQVHVEVRDEGKGFDAQAARDPAKPGGFGLLTISERAALLGGQMEVHSAPGQGSRFVLSLPDPSRPDRADLPAAAGGKPRLRVLLADDHRVVREGLKTLIGEQADMEVVGEADNGRRAVDLADKLAPDVVVMDVAMPIMDGIDATRTIKRESPGVRVVALSMLDADDSRQSMLDAGADAYLVKSGPAEALLAAIRTAAPASGGGEK